MPIICCYVSEADEKELLAEAARSGRTVDELAEAAIANACSESRVNHRADCAASD